MRWVLEHQQYGKNMRTISEFLRDRLYLEAEEADTQNLTKVAENLTDQLEKNSVRNNDAGYTYNYDQFEKDIQKSLWDIVVRASDFYGTHVDSKSAQEAVDYFTQEIVNDFTKRANVKHGIGAYEDPLIGQNGEKVLIEVSDDEE